MNAAPPRPMSKLIALVSSLAVAGVAIFALWNYLGGSGGDAPAKRSAVIAPVREAVAASASHSHACAGRIAALTRGAPGAAAPDIKPCGTEARRLAASGYSALDAATGPDDSPAKAEFLDAAGSLLSVYEMQGDDFDLIHDLVQDAAAKGAPVAALASDIDYTLGNSAADIAAATAQLDRTQAAYRSGG
ncbi:hypothetical protein [Roseovarius dicentrarchi]|uniref:hypothetical protein n=1 Tax=Roseovarius dicentrarchi TaxID=2250573 RepID=UPI000DEB4B19|nr:hypothetical protein [Roseovarius dicentrarchi]